MKFRWVFKAVIIALNLDVNNIWGHVALIHIYVKSERLVFILSRSAREIK